MPYIESFDEFALRMGCEYLRSRDSYLFENGGRSDGDRHSDPPTNAVEVLKLQIEYLEVQLKNEERKFGDCKQYIMTQAQYHLHGSGPAPREGAFGDLKQFQANVRRLREDLEGKRTQLNDLRGPSSQQMLDKMRSREQANAQDAIHRALAVEI
jgi:hypothetical protein